MSDARIDANKAKEMWPELEKSKDGKIKSFSVPDAHTLYVKVYILNTMQLTRHEAIQLPSIDALESLYFMVDSHDGLNYGLKWGLDRYVIDDLRSKGEAEKIDMPFKLQYFLRKTKHSDELKHKG